MWDVLIVLAVTLITFLTSQLHPYAKIAWTVCSSLYQVSMFRLCFATAFTRFDCLGCEEATLDGFQFGLLSKDHERYVLKGGRAKGYSW